MSRIRSAHTRPERELGLALRARSVQYRQHVHVEGGKVDFVLPRFHMVILVHGCFWHGCPTHYHAPANRAAFWKSKLESNRARDRMQTRSLRRAGWKVSVVWEHSILGKSEAVVSRLLLDGRRSRTKQLGAPSRRHHERGVLL